MAVLHSNPYSILAFEKDAGLSLMENNIQVVKVAMKEADDVSMEC